jgi:sodium-coupled neutral amino acid transporter 11
LIVLNAKMSGRKTYIDIMDACFGIRGRMLVSAFQFAFAFGVCTSRLSSDVCEN